MANRRKTAAKPKTNGRGDPSTPSTVSRVSRLLTAHQRGERSTAGRNRKRPAKARRAKRPEEPTAPPAAAPNRPVRRPARPAAASSSPSSFWGAGARATQEALAVALWCVGLLTILSLATFDPADASLNASGSAKVHNWIGPAGAYWADLLLQALGIGAYALGVGLLLAGSRAFVGKRVLPSLREGAGILLLMLCVGGFAHVALEGSPTAYPPGGVAGAVLGRLLLDQFAPIGAHILSGALVLVALAVAADGILTGLGLRGLGTLRVLVRRLHSTWIVHQARRERMAERRAEREAELELDEDEQSTHWTLGATQQLTPLPAYLGGDVRPEGDTTRHERIERAKARGRELADEAADQRDADIQRRAVRAAPEPVAEIADPVDLEAEDPYTLGEVPRLDDTPQAGTESRERRHARSANAAGDRAESRAPDARWDESEDESEDEAQDGAADGAEGGAEELAPPSLPSIVPIRAAEAKLVPDTTEPTLDDACAAGENAPSDEPIPVDTKPKRLIKGKKGRAQEPEIVDLRPTVDIEAIERAAEASSPKERREFNLPSPTLLDIQATERVPVDGERLRDNAQKLTKTLKHYGIEGVVREIRPGPVITMYEFVPSPGTKISKIASLADDLAMSMEALRVRIVAPIPGKGAVGIEIPNENVETVYLKELITHPAYRSSKAALPMALGKDIEGTPYVADMTKMPHLLVAGATGSGKSVSVNTMIMSILFNSTPDEVRLIMVDPKMLELSVYDGIPHLLLPVVTDPKKAAVALRWAVTEMERRYKALSALGVRNIDGYNRKVKAAAGRGEPLQVEIKDKLGNSETVACEHLPYIVIIVDELADLMMVASREVEASIMRLAQMARAAGIHLILATQRPSVDVLTGVIKANFPTRIAFQVASKYDSRTILDTIGAEHLLGRGDQLFLSPGAGGMQRVHGSYVSEEEIERTVTFVKEQAPPQYDESILATEAEQTDAPEEDQETDEMYDQAVAIVLETRQASISMIQRRLRIGYNRAARLVEQMEREGLVGAADGAKPREVLVPAPEM